MSMNYYGPAASVVFPSGSSSAPSVFSMTERSIDPVFEFSYSDPEGTVISNVQAQIFKGSQMVWDSGAIKVPQDEGVLLSSSGYTYLLSLSHFELSQDVLLFGETYSVKIRAMDTTEDPRWQKWGEWSAAKYFKMVLSPLSKYIKFDVEIFADHKEESLLIKWSDNTFEIGEVSGYNLFRSESITGPFTKLNGSLMTGRSLTDPVDPHVRYFYKVQLIMKDGSTAESYPTSSIIVSYWTIGSFKFYGPTSFNKKRSRLQSQRSTLKGKRVIQDKGFLPQEISLEIYLTDDSLSSGAEKYEQLLTELEKLTPLVISDPFGRSWTVAPGSFEDDQLLTGKLEYRVKFDLSEVSA
jgi:hypothetical protein